MDFLDLLSVLGPQHTASGSKEEMRLFQNCSHQGQSQKKKAAALKNGYQRLEEDLPLFEDLEGAARGVMRLQDVYSLSVKGLAKGKFQRVSNAPLPDVYNPSQDFSLSADDCFHIGKVAYDMEDYYHSILWLEEAVSLFRVSYGSWNTEDEGSLEDALDHLAFSYFKAGNISHALSLSQEFLHYGTCFLSRSCHMAQQPPSAPEETNWPEEQEVVATLPPVPQEWWSWGGGCGGDPLGSRSRHHRSRRQQRLGGQRLRGFPRQKKRWRRRQRSHRAQTPAVWRPSQYQQQHLYCSYETNGSPFLMLQPLKREIVHRQPHIALYHDFVSDAEAEKIKELAAPRLQRSVVASGEKQQKADYRISKSAWLKDTLDPAIVALDRRVAALTGLNTQPPYAEYLQVVNYGLGGHYEPHFDHATSRKSPLYRMKSGNRIATLMVYLSLVEAGGSTAFIYANLSIPVVKNAALFWWNLRRNGEGDDDTLHAGCPVLAGDKWVANKWFHEHGQEFRRPCGTSPED
nr:prolyl 4-hydroxylase subunit alpha-3 [Zootoca vivipara]